MILYSEIAADAFETFLARMSPAKVDVWRDLIAGGARSEAFGPLTLQERLDERSVEHALVAGRKQRVINLVVAALVVLVVGGGLAAGWRTLSNRDQRTRGALQFSQTDETPAEAAVLGGPPVVEPALTVALSETVAVLAGNEPLADRVTDAAFSTFAFPPGALGASLFEYAGTGHVVIVGPVGFSDLACLRVSVVTSDLRPLDTVTHGPCSEPVGRPAVVGCAGPSAILLGLDIASGEVDLPEGGTGFADAVRLQMIGDRPDEYEVLTVRGTISVDPDAGIVIPRFGGATGEQITFDIGSGRSGTCTLTGNISGNN